MVNLLQKVVPLMLIISVMLIKTCNALSRHVPTYTTLISQPAANYLG